MERTYIAIDLALVAGHDSGDVFLENRGQLVSVADVVDPPGKLRVPEEGVATDGLVIGGGPVDEVVGLTKVILAPLGLNAIPLHAVLGRDLAEVLLQNDRVFARGETALVGAGTKVELALGLHQSVDALAGLTSLQVVGGGCCHGRQRRQ